MENNIKRKPGRIKNDTCIKAYQLINTMELTNEEFGLLIRKILIEDDNKETRFENINEVIKKAYLKKEEKWLKEFDEMIENKTHIISSYGTILGQTTKSRKAFENWQDQKQKELNKADEKTKTKKAIEDTPEEENNTETIRNWLQGTDEEIENDKEEIMIEIADNEEFRNNEHINEDQQNGDLFNQLANADLSKEMLAADILKEYLKNIWGE